MRRKTAILTISYLSCAVIALGVFSFIHYGRAERYAQFMRSRYQYSFNELVNSMSEIDFALQKSIYATSPCMAGAICTEVFGKAMMAQMSLGSLPFSTQELEQTASFISRVGDYSFALSRSAARGNTFSEEELNNLIKLSDTASLLAQNLRDLQVDMADGHLGAQEIEASQDRMDKVEAEYLSGQLSDSMRKIEQEFPEVPTLIYDGPYSQHITGIKPRTLEGLEEIDENKARKAAANFLGISEGRVYLTSKSEGSIPAYHFNAKVNGGELSIVITRKGGKVLSLLNSRQPKDSSIDAKEAVGIAKRFLERRGFKNMAESYYITQNNILTANFAYKQDEVTCYTDLVKVSVALDTGAVIGFEARGYITAHYERDLPETKVSVDEARKLVSNKLEILSEGLALIPTDGQYEVLCHEFKCRTEEDKHYIVYVNAVTGLQERILILLEDESGTLTI
ncbi:MAG TPA: germination protein YpeB [Clostridiales bacterium]|nr:germination protein YpeB [Clostridiales bacterium]